MTLVVPCFSFLRLLLTWSVICPINDSFYSCVCFEKIWVNKLYAFLKSLGVWICWPWGKFDKSKFMNSLHFSGYRSVIYRKMANFWLWDKDSVIRCFQSDAIIILLKKKRLSYTLRLKAIYRFLTQFKINQMRI